LQFLFIICHDDQFRPTDALVSDIHAWVRDLEAQGIRIHGNPLQPARQAWTVRFRRGRPTRKRGPYSQSKEQICAYELIECATEDDAVALAARHPMAKVATVEVRPVWNELAG